MKQKFFSTLVQKGWSFLLIATLHIFILTKLQFFPYPELFVYPYLTNNGLLPYSQIMDQHFPGLMFLPINLDNLGMKDEVSARIWLIALVTISQILLFFVTKNIFKSVGLGLLASLVYLIWQPFLEGWVLWINTFLPIIYLGTFYFCYKFLEDRQKNEASVLKSPRSANWRMLLFDRFIRGLKVIRFSQSANRYLVIIGLLLGVAVVFKQVALPLSGLVFLLLWYYKRNFSTLMYFCLGFLPPVLLMLGYLFSIGVFEDFWYWTVLFNLTTYAKYGGKEPFFSGFVRVIGIYSPILLLPFLKDKKLSLLLLVFILGGMSGVWHRFDFVHFQPSLPFVILATVAIANKFYKSLVGKLGIVFYLVVVCLWLVTFYKGHLGDRVLFFDNDTKKISQKIQGLTDPGEEIFIFGAVPHLYQMSQTIPAGRVFVFQFPWFFLEAEEDIYQGLVTSQPNIVVADRSVVIEGDAITRFGQRIDGYINDNYEEVDRVGSTQILKKK